MLAPQINVVATPLDLPWAKELNYNFQKYKNYRYIMGDLEYGEMRFRGQIEQIYETELIIKFFKSKISKAWLVIGPVGINEFNCKVRYKDIVSAMSKKYGPPRFREIIRESIMEELVFASECYAIGVGVAEINTTWKIPHFEIEASLFSDEGIIYIEIEYVYIPLKGMSESSLHNHL